MQTSICLNCANHLTPGQKFCGACSQKSNFHRFTIGHVLHEVFHTVTHADAGFFVLVKELAKNPGRVADEYVNGKIKKYFSPFTFLLLCVGFFVLVNNTLKTYPDAPKADPAILKIIPTAEQRQNYLMLIDRTGKASTALSKNSNLITVIAMPLYTFIVWLFFRRRGRNFAEIAIAMIFFTAFSSLASTILFHPLLAYYKGTPTFLSIFLLTILLQSLFYTWGFKTFFKYESITGFLKIWPVIVLTFVTWIFITMLAFFFYVYRENTAKVLSALWDKFV